MNTLRKRFFQRPIFLTGFIACFLAFLILMTSSATAVPWYTESINVESKIGTDRSIQSLDIMYPLSHSTSSLTFTDLRGRIDDDQSIEVNLGLAQRSVIENPTGLGDDAVFGVYGFADRLESEFDNVFYQGTLGAEYFTKDYSLRINGYLPEDDRKPTTTFTQLRATGTQIFFEDRRSFERPLPGYDVEVGRTVRFDWGQLYGRGSYFRFHHSDVAEVEGARLRTGIQIPASTFASNWLDAGQVTLGAEWQTDQVRDEQTFGVFRVSVPFGTQVSGVRDQGSGNNNSEPRTMNSELRSWQKDRLTERIERDVDIVTGQPDEPVVADTKPAVNAANGNALTSVGLARANASGTGTISNPGSLSNAINAAGSNGTIFVVNTGGTLTTSGVIVRNGQSLIGGQQKLLLETPDGSARHVFSLGGGRPTIRGTTSKPTIQLDTGTQGQSLENLTIVGQGEAIRSTNNSNVTLNNLSLRNNSGKALNIRKASGSVTLRNVKAIESEGGLNLSNGSADVRLSNTDFKSKGQVVLSIHDKSGGSLVADAGSSFRAETAPVGIQINNSSSSLSVSNLTTRNTDTGISLTSGSGIAKFNNVDINVDRTGLTADNSGRVTVNGGTIAVASGGGDAVRMNRSLDLVLEDLTLQSQSGNSLELRDIVGDAIMRDVRATAEGHGLKVSGLAPDLTVQTSDFRSTDAAVISTKNAYGGNLTGGINTHWTSESSSAGLKFRDGEMDVNLWNLTIGSSADTGIRLEGYDGSVRLTNLSTSGPVSQGIAVRGGNGDLSLNNVDMTSRGSEVLSVRNKTSGSIQADSVSSFRAENAPVGVRMVNSPSSLSISNLTTRNTDTGISLTKGSGSFEVKNVDLDVNQTGLNADGQNGRVTVKGGSITVASGGRNAVSVSGGTTAYVSDLNLNSNGAGHGMALQNPSGSWTLRNLDVDAEQHGLHVDGGNATLSMTGLTVNSNSSDGLRLENLSGGSVTLENSHVTGANASGLSLKSVSDATITDLTVENVGTGGVELVNSSSITGDSWTIGSSSGHGVEIDNSSDVRLSKASIAASLDGVNVQSSSNLMFESFDVSAVGSDNDGFHFNQSDSVAMNNLSLDVEGYRQDGVYAENASGTWTIENSTISADDQGINFYQGTANVTLSGITASSNLREAVILNEISSGTVRNVRVPDGNSGLEAIGLQSFSGDSITIENAQIGFGFNNTDNIKLNNLRANSIGGAGINLSATKDVNITGIDGYEPEKLNC